MNTSTHTTTHPSSLKLAVLLTITLLSGLITSCHTVHGAGEDINHAGRRIERAADSAH